MTPEQLAALRAAASKAEALEPSPWRVRKDETTGAYSAVLNADGMGVAIDLLDDVARHVALANPAAILALLDEREWLVQMGIVLVSSMHDRRRSRRRRARAAGVWG